MTDSGKLGTSPGRSIDSKGIGDTDINDIVILKVCGVRHNISDNAVLHQIII